MLVEDAEPCSLAVGSAEPCRLVLNSADRHTTGGHSMPALPNGGRPGRIRLSGSKKSFAVSRPRSPNSSENSKPPRQE